MSGFYFGYKLFAIIIQPSQFWHVLSQMSRYGLWSYTKWIYLYDMPPVPDWLSQGQNQPWFWTDSTSKSWWVHVPPITTLVGPIVLTSFKAFCMSLKSPEFKAMTSIPIFQKLRKHEGLRHLSEYLYAPICMLCIREYHIVDNYQ